MENFNYPENNSGESICELNILMLHEYFGNYEDRELQYFISVIRYAHIYYFSRISKLILPIMSLASKGFINLGDVNLNKLMNERPNDFINFYVTIEPCIDFNENNLKLFLPEDLEYNSKKKIFIYSSILKALLRFIKIINTNFKMISDDNVYLNIKRVVDIYENYHNLVLEDSFIVDKKSIEPISESQE